MVNAFGTSVWIIHLLCEGFETTYCKIFLECIHTMLSFSDTNDVQCWRWFSVSRSQLMKCFHHHLWVPSCLHVAATSVLLVLNLELVSVDDFDVFFSYIIIVGLRSPIVVHFLGYESFCNPQVIHSFGCWCCIIHCAVAQYSNTAHVCACSYGLFFTWQKEICSFVFDCIFQMWNSNRLLVRTSFLALDLYPSHRWQTVVN